MPDEFEIPEAVHSLELQDPERFWVLGSGKATLFIIESSGSGETARRPVMECEAPACFFGLADPSLQFLVKGSEGTEIDAFPLEKLLQAPGHMRMLLLGLERILSSLGAVSALTEFRTLPSPTSRAELNELRARMQGWTLAAWEIQTAEEIERMVNKILDAEGVIQFATRKLSSVLTGESVADSGEGNRLFRAFRLAGHAAGITAEDHPASETLPTLELRVQAIARASQCRVRSVELAGRWWTGDNGPLLGFMGEDSSPVALTRRRRRYWIVDPETQIQKQVSEESASTLNPVAYTFYRPFPNKPIHWRDLVKFAMRGMLRDTVWLLATGIAMGLIGLLTPLATQAIFDFIIPGAERVQLFQIAFGLFAAAIAFVAFQTVQGFACLRQETRAGKEVQSAVMDRLLKLPPPFFRKYNVGDLANRASAADAIRRVISGLGITTVLSALSSSSNFFVLLNHGWQLALLAVGATALSVAVTAGTNLWALRYVRQVEELEGKISGMVNQFLTGISKLRIAGAEGHAFAVWADSFSEKKRLKIRERLIQNGLTVFNTIYGPLVTLTIFILVAMALTENSGISIGSFLAFSAAFGAFSAAIIALSNATINLAVAIPLYERARPILTEPTETMKAKTAPGELYGNIEVKHVTFRYQPDGPVVLKDVSIKVRAGEFVAIVGPSGSGKSTLLRLLLGFEQPENGAIYVDGQSLDSLDLTEVRRQIGVVLQSSRLLPGDIFTNIVSNSGADQKQAWEAAAHAGIALDIKAMPMGMQTVITEGGGGFSGGQRQRLMIARALVGKPRLLFFDEATSALDNLTQTQVSESLEQLRAARVVIAHRLSTIEKADRIYVMVDGSVVEEGDYQTLMNQNGVFTKLALRQIV